jgi:hypothetical protein
VFSQAGFGLPPAVHGLVASVCSLVSLTLDMFPRLSACPDATGVFPAGETPASSFSPVSVTTGVSGPGTRSYGSPAQGHEFDRLGSWPDRRRRWGHQRCQPGLFRIPSGRSERSTRPSSEARSGSRWAGPSSAAGRDRRHLRPGRPRPLCPIHPHRRKISI